MNILHKSTWTPENGFPLLVRVDEHADNDGPYRVVTINIQGELTPDESRRLRDDLDRAIDLAEDDGTGVLWATQPRWTRAHAIEHAGSMGAEQLWATQCNRDFPVPSPATDKPAPAPRDMPRCTHCSAALRGEFRG